MDKSEENETTRRPLRSQVLSNWFQVGASLAVVLSIGVLALELKQQRELAQAQFIIDTVAMRMQSDIIVLGEDMGEVLARACFDSDSLTNADLTKLEKYFELRIAGITTIREAEVIGGTPAPTWPNRLRGELIKIWRYGAGKAWWQENRSIWPTEILEIADQLEIDNVPDSVPACEAGELHSR